MLRVHRGFFLSMGVHDWSRFADVARLAVKDPEFVREMMRIQGEFAARMAERVLSEVEIDSADEPEFAAKITAEVPVIHSIDINLAGPQTVQTPFEDAWNQ